MAESIATPAEAQRPAGGPKPASVPLLPYRPAIDGLRGIAVLAVLAFHLKQGWLPGGFVGVDIFFVISGYLITSILRRENETGRFRPVRFFQRRISRLMPAFFTVALATYIGARLIYTGQDLASAGANLSAAALSIANIKAMMEGNYFTMSPDAQPYLHYWSLSVEEQFYILFPLIYFVADRYARRWRRPVLLGLAAFSLAECIYLTQRNQAHAFYLLPTRAWELLAGAILADLNLKVGKATQKWGAWLSLIGLAAIVASLFFIGDNGRFPGYIAALPVFATMCILQPMGVNGVAERILAIRPLPLLGRISYSLYLWHWPVFSLVDYRLYDHSEGLRLALKLGLSFGLAVLCYVLIEAPGRVYLNVPRRQWMAFLFLACGVATCGPLGVWTRRSNFVNAEMADVARGGLHFNSSGRKGTILLMGDSEASMYGSTLREVAKQADMTLTVVSVSAGEPLPRHDGFEPTLWKESLAVVKRDRPEVVVLACDWEVWLRNNREALPAAVKQIENAAGRVILITQQPQLPENASRQEIRAGQKPPFWEDTDERDSRMASNAFVKSLAGVRVQVLDVERFFGDGHGEVYFTSDGRQLFFDRNHLSNLGTDLVKGEFLKTLEEPGPPNNRSK